MALTTEQIAQFKKEQIDKCDKEIAELEIAIADLTNQRNKELESLNNKLDSLKYQRNLFFNG